MDTGPPVLMNLIGGWVCILMGFFSGAIPGLFFWREGWLGGYGSWPRRMIRLAHISFFGLGFINLAFALTSFRMEPSAGIPPTASLFLLAGAITMPMVCYLAAWRQSLRHLFPFPVSSLMLGVAIFLWKGLQ